MLSTAARLGAQAWLPARAHVRAAIERRLEVDASGEIFRLDTFCPWKAHLYELEEELALPKPLKFCIYEVRRAARGRAATVIFMPLLNESQLMCHSYATLDANNIVPRSVKSLDLRRALS